MVTRGLIDSVLQFSMEVCRGGRIFFSGSTSDCVERSGNQHCFSSTPGRKMRALRQELRDLNTVEERLPVGSRGGGLAQKKKVAATGYPVV